MVMPTYPGVYVEEVSSGVRPITAASTSTAAFIGQAERGSFNEAVKINNFTQYQNLYGEFLRNSHLAYAVYQFFNNGGSQCYIVRVTGEGAQEASITLIDRQQTSPGESLTISASSVGSWGNSLSIEITDGTKDPTNEFNLSVYRGDDKIEAFENLSVISSAPNFVDTVTSTSKYIRTEFIGSNAKQPGTSKSKEEIDLSNGLSKTKFRINIDGDGYQEIDLREAVTEGGVADLNSLGNVAAAIQFVVGRLEKKLRTTEQKAFDDFRCTSENDTNTLVLASGSEGAASSVSVAPAVENSDDATEQLKLGRRQEGIEALGGASARPKENNKNAQNNVILYPLGKEMDNISKFSRGIEGGSVNEQSYIKALDLLNDKDDVSLIAIPGVGDQAVIGGGMNYCSNRSLKDCFFIGDIPQDKQTDTAAQDYVSLLSPQNSYGAVYLPWLQMLDPTGRSSELITVPPSGYVAGIYAKTDAQRGVWKAPAGTTTALAGTVGLTVNFTDTQQGNLNPAHINCIRQFTGSGTVIWGARTVSSDAEWRYIPVRRMAILLRVSIYRGIQWAVFEPNDEELWSQLRLNINAFMMTLYHRGAFQGSMPRQAFFVKCDNETTTQTDIDNGIVNVLIGFAPLKPAEFVMVKISQTTGQTA